MILIKCFLYRNKRALFVRGEGSRPYHKRQRQIFIREQKMSMVASNRGEIFLSLLVKMFNGVRCLSGLLVEILCFPLRSTNETVFLSVKHTMKSTSWSAENANTCLSLCWLCVSRRSFLFLTIMVWGPGFVLVFIPWGKEWSSCLSSFCVASEPAFVSLEGIPGLLNKSIPSLAEWYGMCHQGNKLWGFTALPVWWLLILYA